MVQIRLQNNFSLVVSGIFWSQQIYIISVSGFRMHFIKFISKICQTVVGIGMTSQFHEFFCLIFGRFLLFRPTRLWVGGRRRPQLTIECTASNQKFPQHVIKDLQRPQKLVKCPRVDVYDDQVLFPNYFFCFVSLSFLETWEVKTLVGIECQWPRIKKALSHDM